MTRKALVMLLSAAALLASARADAALENVRGAILMNLKSESVLYIQDENRKVPPASLTKVMTMYVASDAISADKVSLSDSVKISRRAASQGGSSLHLKEGDVVSLDLLLAGAAAVSGNDAAVAVAEHVSGSVTEFLRLMNAKASELGMKNTKYVNVNGLPAQEQVTTARDMLTLTKRYISDYPDNLRYHNIPSIEYGGFVNTNKNPLLESCPGADGLKTGWVNASGYSLIGTAKRGDIRLVSVVLGGVKPEDMARESLRLIEAGFKTVASGGKIKVKQFLAEDEEQ
ncbi:MAG: D-alanyl-D-alanine carboxypeptidase [Synergistaceae bacterium]|jgi:D-alanyl-D-alanine carboxypeptidase (penicillin-binding protein 5/6)|nr:D-alanyl-D-alanine carboxypeptidase [Synergistaceae bacterium]